MCSPVHRQFDLACSTSRLGHLKSHEGVGDPFDLDHQSSGTIGGHDQFHSSPWSPILRGEQVDILSGTLIEPVHLDGVAPGKREPQLSGDSQTDAGHPLLEWVH